jgi:translocation and assembly module TamA
VMRATESDDSRLFWLLGFPASLIWDRSDYLTTPRHGWLIDLELQPYLDLDSGYPIFVRDSATINLFLALDPKQLFTIVPSLHIGSIAGASEVNVPPPIRFFAGNARYMRGYNYMTVCPLGDDHHPLGGRSILVVAFEPRVRLTKKLDFVVSHEWGNVFAESLPQFDRKLLRSLSIGIRYHTLMGPARLDVAFPLDRREDVDKPVQFYFSVGASY